ncbi:MAG: PQQ-binding-like beta-propeller repeat protein, partial [Acidobacteriota bacterium]|nr:PQQ-binding-like beta-propeller repeat protein [Acidobacteriota bacterium]
YATLEQHRAQQQQSAPPPQATEPQMTSEPLASPPPSPTEQQATPSANASPTPLQNAAVASATVTNQASAQIAEPPPSTRPRRNYWTNFRGPNRDGRYNDATVKTNFGAEGLPLLWRQPIGGGYASFVVADGAAFTIEQRRAQEVVAAYHIETGRELWTHSWSGEFRESMGGDGPRATPTWDAGRIFALGAAGELRCLDAKTGKLIWSKNILSDNGATNLQWGMAASPLIVGDNVIVQPGGSAGKSVVAYNKTTGAPVWKVMNDQASYTSPMMVTLAGKRQLLIVTARRIAGLTPEDGSVLWEHPWSNSASINISQPIIVNANQFFISAGYGKGASLVEISGSGKTFAARAVWENNSIKNKFNSSVLHEGHIYGLDEGILTCVDVVTGERKWKGGRYGYGQVLLAGGTLIVTTEEGEIVFVKAAPAQHEEVSRFSALQGRTWNNPAIADGRLLVRNATQMACYKLTD